MYTHNWATPFIIIIIMSKIITQKIKCKIITQKIAYNWSKLKAKHSLVKWAEKLSLSLPRFSTFVLCCCCCLLFTFSFHAFDFEMWNKSQCSWMKCKRIEFQNERWRGESEKEERQNDSNSKRLSYSKLLKPNSRKQIGIIDLCLIDFYNFCG